MRKMLLTIVGLSMYCGLAIADDFDGTYRGSINYGYGCSAPGSTAVITMNVTGGAASVGLPTQTLKGKIGSGGTVILTGRDLSNSGVQPHLDGKIEGGTYTAKGAYGSCAIAARLERQG